MKKLLIILVFLFPSVTFAGFIPDVIWVSNESPTHGDIIDVYATVFNTSNEHLEGTVQYYNAGTLLGEVPVIVGQDAAKLTVFSWESIEGNHTISAQFMQNDVLSEKTDVVHVTVLPAPEPEPEIEESATNQNELPVVLPEMIGDFEIPSLVHTTLETTETGRIATVDFLDNQHEKIQSKKQEQVTSATAENVSDSDDESPTYGDMQTGENEITTEDSAVRNVTDSALLAMLPALSFVAGSPLLFYGLFVLLFILFIRFIIKKYRHNHHRY